MKIGYVQPHSLEVTSESHRDLSEFLGYPNYHCKLMCEKGHECDLLTLSRSESGEIRHTYGHLIKRYEVSVGNSFGTETSMSLLWNLITSDYDLIHFRGFKQYNVLPLLPIISKFKPVLVHHLGSADSYPDNIKTKIALYLLNHAHGVAALNKNEIENLTSAGFSTQKLHYLPNAINKTVFKPRSKKKAQKKLYHEFDEKSLLYVGRITGPKNVPLLVSSMKRVLDHYPRAKLLIVGSGNDTEVEEVETRISKDGLCDRVELVGEVNQQKLVHYYNSADLGVFPSSGEGLGMVALEASACKTPFIGTSAHESEIFVPSENYIQVDPLTKESLSSTIINALQDDRKTKAMAKNAYESVMSELSPEEIYNKNINAYQKSVQNFEKRI